MSQSTNSKFSSFVDSFDELVFYLENEFPKDVQFVLYQLVGPFLVGVLALQGIVAFFRAVYKIIFPPGAEELHRSALATLHHHKRVQREVEVSQRQAEKLLIKALEKDDLYFPAYLSLASLYIYRMKQPAKALKVLEKAKDRGPIRKLEPLIVDAKALNVGGNENMVQAGGSIFHEHDYLSINEYWNT